MKKNRAGSRTGSRGLKKAGGLRLPAPGGGERTKSKYGGMGMKKKTRKKQEEKPKNIG